MLAKPNQLLLPLVTEPTLWQIHPFLGRRTRASTRIPFWMLLRGANPDAGPMARIDPGQHPLDMLQLPTRSMMEAPTLWRATPCGLLPVLPTDKVGPAPRSTVRGEPLPLLDDARGSWVNSLPNCPN